MHIVAAADVFACMCVPASVRMYVSMGMIYTWNPDDIFGCKICQDTCILHMKNYAHDPGFVVAAIGWFYPDFQASEFIRLYRINFAVAPVPGE